MFQISYDTVKNRINVKIVGSITMDEVDTYNQEYKKVLEQVKPGFTGMTDLSEGKLFTQEVAAALAPLGELSVQKGLSKWAYYTGSSITKMQMKRMFGDIVICFDKIEEAEAYLA